ncbi:FecCD family ABC transporter permease [Salibacterium halotolerans]|uniref:Iron complex transport system permease protein n=1 Tax=Salibacterium halotolerans TaxID=1884432 RepID=A0A1I5NY25_9BACI|nr:iron ABC transporter permease [Salibacterium halotolerans]SFP26196.1 iron complex transport system permease protein [Salibacterium halotolerans]
MFSTNKAWTSVGIGVCFAVLSIWMGVSVGSVAVPLPVSAEILGRTVLGFDMPAHISDTDAAIITDIRLPRVVLAALVGASLAAAGAAFQGLLQNPLADPYTLGVSSGSALGAVIVLYTGFTIPLTGSFTLPIISIGTGGLTLLFILTFVRWIEPQMRTETLILAGVIVSSFLGACLSLIIALTGDELRQIISWLMGSVSMRGWDYAGLLLPFLLTGSILLLMNMKELNALVFGEETARTLGVSPEQSRMMVLGAASLLTGAAVAVSGTIGFAGLVVPHIVRLLTGPDHRLVLPVSMLGGAGFLVLTDLAARTVIAPVELPIGVITAVLGAPVFGFLLYQQRRSKQRR